MGKLPIIGPLLCFDLRAHGRAAIKAVSLWVLVTSPILFAILMSQRVPSENTMDGWASSVKSIFLDFFENDGIYVYTVSFTAPFLFIGFGRLFEAVKTRNGSTVMRSVFDGYWLYFIVCFVLLIITAVAFTASLLSSDSYKKTILFYISGDKPFLIYFASIYFWYLAIVDEAPSQGDFNVLAKNAEDEAASAFHRRVNKG